MNPTLSLQLYTVRDLMQADPLGTLEKIAALGYQGVETGGYRNKPEQIAKIQELGLKITGTHVGIETLQQHMDEVIAENKGFDNSIIIVPWIGEEWRGSEETWIKTAKVLEGLGQTLHEAGLTLCYHNHAFELEEQYASGNGLELLYANADPQYLQAEIDVYWVAKGGGNPVEYLRRYNGRVPVVHLKDIDKEGNFTEVGEGLLDWPAIFAAAEAGGVVSYAVEQDVCPGNPLDSIAKSIENLRSWGKV